MNFNPMIAKKITSITPNGKPWGEPPNGPLYPFKLEFDDGMVGVANSKSQTPPYKVGDTVGVEVTGQDARGNSKLKIDRKWPSMNPGATGSAFTPSQPQNPVKSTESASNAVPQSSIHPATAGCAFKAAVDAICKDDVGTQEYYKRVHEVASGYVRILQALEAGKLAQPKAVQQAVEQAKAAGFTPDSDEPPF